MAGKKDETEASQRNADYINGRPPDRLINQVDKQPLPMEIAFKALEERVRRLEKNALFLGVDGHFQAGIGQRGIQ